MKATIEKIKNKIKQIDKRYYIIFIIAVIISIPNMKKEMVQGDDYLYHIANLYAIDQNISLDDGNIFPNKINPVMANDLGYGDAIFYPQLPYLVTTAINLVVKHFGGDILSSVKIYEFVIILLAGIVMYKLVKLIFKNKNASLASSIIYMCSPYFMYDIYLRMAYGEFALFVFVPIALMSIYYIIHKEYKKFIMLFVLGYCGMILSHLVMTVFFTILLTVILLLNIKKLLNKKAIQSFFIATVIVFGITSPFIVPMLEHKVKGNYVVFQDGEMAYLEKLNVYRLNIDDLVLNNETIKTPKYISIITIALIGLSIITYKKIFKKDENELRRAFIVIIITTFIAFIISSIFIDWNNVPKIFWNIQYPWRMSLFISIGSSIIAGLAILNFKNLETIKIMFVIISIVALTDVAKISHSKGFHLTQMPSYEELSGLSNYACGGQREYLPVNAKQNLKYLDKRKKDIKIVSGNAKISKVLKTKTPYIEFEVKQKNNEKIRLELPRIFYYGYDIKYKDTNEKIDYYENDKGLIEIEINRTGIIVVDYIGTDLNTISNIISVISLIIYLIIIYPKKSKIEKN